MVSGPVFRVYIQLTNERKNKFIRKRLNSSENQQDEDGSPRDGSWTGSSQARRLRTRYDIVSQAN